MFGFYGSDDITSLKLSNTNNTTNTAVEPEPLTMDKVVAQVGMIAYKQPVDTDILCSRVVMESVIQKLTTKRDQPEKAELTAAHIFGMRLFLDMDDEVPRDELHIGHFDVIDGKAKFITSKVIKILL